MDYAVLLGLSAGLGGVLLHSSGCVGVGVHDVVQLRGVGHEVVEFGAGPLARGEVFPAAGAQGYLSAVVLRQDVVAVAGCVGPQEQGRGVAAVGLLRGGERGAEQGGEGGR